MEFVDVAQVRYTELHDWDEIIFFAVEEFWPSS